MPKVSTMVEETSESTVLDITGTSKEISSTMSTTSIDHSGKARSNKWNSRKHMTPNTYSFRGANANLKKKFFTKGTKEGAIFDKAYNAILTYIGQPIMTRYTRHLN